jgi:hypothetical protein
MDKSFQLHSELRSGYLYARVTGQNSAETVQHYMQDIVAECQNQQCFRVLIDEQLDGPRLDAIEIFSIASDGAMNTLGVFQAIAYVDPHMGDMADFAETVAVNRGMPVKSFSTIAEAEDWLLRQDEGSSEKDIFEDHNSRNRYR